MRRLRTTLGLLAVLILLAPVPAQAWWGWLDDLSGPGPFWGAEFDFRVACLMEESPWAESVANLQIAEALLRADAAKPSTDKLTAAGKLAELQKNLLTTVAKPSGAIAAAKIVEDILATTADLDEATKTALDRAASSIRATAVPRVSKFPGSVVWSSCADRSASGDNTAIKHRDRHEVLSLVLNYREYWNSDYTNWGHVSSDTFANGEIIHLRIIEPKVSWPISGHLDILDAQTGIGMYSFSSKGFPGARVGLIVEPIRFDLHFPSKFADDRRNFFARLAMALSLRSGLVMFPGGFAPDAFAAKGPAARQISGEATFEFGIVVNVGRLGQGKAR
jgi:hypothetical protein